MVRRLFMNLIVAWSLQSLNEWTQSERKLRLRIDPFALAYGAKLLLL